MLLNSYFGVNICKPIYWCRSSVCWFMLKSKRKQDWNKDSITCLKSWTEYTSVPIPYLWLNGKCGIWKSRCHIHNVILKTSSHSHCSSTLYVLNCYEERLMCICILSHSTLKCIACRDWLTRKHKTKQNKKKKPQQKQNISSSQL